MNKYELWDTIEHWHNVNGVQLAVLQNAIEPVVSKLEAAARADERKKTCAELTKWICCNHFHEDDLLAKIEEMSK